MPRFLTQAWVEQFNRALGGVAVTAPGDDAGLAAQSGRFVVCQEVHGAPEGDVRLTLSAGDGSLRMSLSTVAGAPDDVTPVGEEEVRPDVTMVVSYADAAAMARGELLPSEALTAGRVRVRGDLSVLIASYQMVAGARAATRSLGQSTTY